VSKAVASVIITQLPTVGCDVRSSRIAIRRVTARSPRPGVVHQA